MTTSTSTIIDDVIDIPQDVLPRRGEYLRHVITEGHRPGVLSGAELAGKARQYGGWYSRQRDVAEQLVAPYGVASALTLINSRWCRVWSDAQGQQVRLQIVEGGGVGVSAAASPRRPCPPA